MQTPASSHLTIENNRVQISVLPSFGARVVSLLDLAAGRQWLVEGEPVGEVGADAPYGALEARGWDECFPTVAAGHHESWPNRLRDHGELWGRPWHAHADDCAITAWRETDRFRFCRRIELHDQILDVSYLVTNLDRRKFSYLWSQHCLLAVSAADRIQLNGVSDMNLYDGVFDGRKLSRQSICWPDLPDPCLNLSEVKMADSGLALKIHARAGNQVSAMVSNGRSAIEFSWSGSDAPALGLWLDYGGWPETSPVHQIAIEPTTGLSDSLEMTDKTAMTRTLAPGCTHRWKVRIALGQLN